jgi:murein DD-endopeptidase MepM/ murein hydrolase activator NlpD
VKLDVWTRKRKPPQYGPADWDNYYQAGRPYPRGSGPRDYRKTLRRAGIALAILLFLLAVRELPYPVGQQVRDNLRYLLTAEWNFQPVAQKVVQIGLQMVNVDAPFFNHVPRDNSYAPVSGPAGTEGLMLPVSGKVVREFGWSKDPADGLEKFHHGIDIQAAPGTEVRAALPGKVVQTGVDPVLGPYLMLDHGAGTKSFYAGLEPADTSLEREFTAGEVIGRIGPEGDVDGGGLHFELRENDKLVDPLSRLQAGH